MLGKRLPPWTTACLVLMLLAWLLTLGWYAVRQVQRLSEPEPGPGSRPGVRDVRYRDALTVAFSGRARDSVGARLASDREYPIEKVPTWTNWGARSSW